MVCYIDARVHKESRKLFDSAAQDAGPRLHLEGQLEHALDLLWGEAGDLGDMAQGGRHLAASVSDGLWYAFATNAELPVLARPRIP